MLDIPSEVKFLLQRDGIRKNIRIHFPDGEFEDICNDKIVLNSVKFTESMCSRNELKFGLTEASTFQCDVVDMPNMNGCQIFVQNEIDCSSLGEDWCRDNAQTSEDLDFPFYPVPYGLMIVDSSKKQNDMSKRKIIAYSYTFTDGISELTKMALADKINIEPMKLKPTIQFEIMHLAGCNFPDKKMDDIFDFHLLPPHEEVLPGEKNPTDIQRSWGILRLNYHTRDFPAQVIGWEDDEYRYSLTFNYWEINLLCENTNEYHELLYIPSVESLANTTDIYDYYERMPNFIQGKISFEEFQARTSKNWVYSEASDIRYGKGNYVYMQNRIDSKSPYYHYRYVCVPYGVHWVMTPKNPYDRGRYEDLELKNKDDIKVYYCDSKYPAMYFDMLKTVDVNGRPMVNIGSTLEMFESYLELQGLFGRFKRDGKFDLMTPEGMSALYPSTKLYPSNNLFTRGAKIHSSASSYTSIWYDDELSKPYGRVSAMYKRYDATQKAEVEEYAYYDLVNDFEAYPDKYIEYSMSENFFIKNMTWEYSDLLALFRLIGNKIRNIRYMPCQYKGIGLPFLEAGDTLEIQTSDGDMRTIIFNRTLAGEQLLTDTIKTN